MKIFKSRKFFRDFFVDIDTCCNYNVDIPKMYIREVKKHGKDKFLYQKGRNYKR